jgi:hypothetical protein
VGSLSRAVCRAEAEHRFSPQAMVDGYVAVYRRLLEPGLAPAPETGSAHVSDASCEHCARSRLANLRLATRRLERRMARAGHRGPGTETALRAAETVLRDIREDERGGSAAPVQVPRDHGANTDGSFGGKPHGRVTCAHRLDQR